MNDFEQFSIDLSPAKKIASDVYMFLDVYFIVIFSFIYEMMRFNP